MFGDRAGQSGDVGEAAIIEITIVAGSSTAPLDNSSQIIALHLWGCASIVGVGSPKRAAHDISIQHIEQGVVEEHH